MTAPNTEGIIRCIQEAIEEAEISNREINAISGHLTATMGDPGEVAAWMKGLNRSGTDFPYINSLKSLIGHCLSAAGSIEAVATVLQLYRGFLHKSANCEDLHPDIESVIAKNKIPFETLYPDRLNIMAKASFGFGDVNSCIIFKKFTY
jgi:3-oxoacyl-(acyl-carrier-protein) synthase